MSLPLFLIILRYNPGFYSHNLKANILESIELENQQMVLLLNSDIYLNTLSIRDISMNQMNKLNKPIKFKNKEVNGEFSQLVLQNGNFTFLITDPSSIQIHFWILSSGSCEKFYYISSDYSIETTFDSSSIGTPLCLFSQTNIKEAKILLNTPQFEIVTTRKTYFPKDQINSIITINSSYYIKLIKGITNTHLKISVQRDDLQSNPCEISQIPHFSQPSEPPQNNFEIMCRSSATKFLNLIVKIIILVLAIIIVSIFIIIAFLSLKTGSCLCFLEELRFGTLKEKPFVKQVSNPADDVITVEEEEQ